MGLGGFGLLDAVLGMPLHSIVIRSAALTYYLIFGGVGDVILLGIRALWKDRHLVHRVVTDSEVISIVQSASVAIIGLLLFRFLLHFSKSGNHPKWKGPMKPMLFPCRTTHARFFPKKHSFSYSYLLVGIPVDWKGVAGGMVSVDDAKEHTRSSWFSRYTKGWYQINAADYLERGSGHLGLRGKLDAYLKTQNVDLSQYPHAYLVTAAKFLGYHFNPVSFWYLYSAEKDLKAMVLEVNNTFDERHMYFLPADDAGQDMIESPETGLTAVKDHEGATKSKTLRRAWPKDFHVSPFNSRKGGYSLIAHDPWAPMMEGCGLINNTIKLVSSKSHAKLVARIFSEGEAIDPTSMTVWQKLKFLSAWWWVGFVTFPRIVKEAAVIFFQRKLHVWYRPEPLRQSIGRRADETETLLEPVFRRYLQHLVSQCPDPLVVRYIPSGIANVYPETFRSSSATTEKDSQPGSGTNELEFKVLTPVFYSRFVYYAHDLEALFCELNDNCTVWVSRPDLLPRLVFKKPSPLLQTSSYMDYACFKLIQTLRQRPARIERPLTSSQAPVTASTTHTTTDIRDFRLSSMDGYVLSEGDAGTRKTYRSLVLRLFVAERVALGSVDLLWLEQVVLRLLLAWLVI